KKLRELYRSSNLEVKILGFSLFLSLCNLGSYAQPNERLGADSFQLQNLTITKDKNRKTGEHFDTVNFYVAFNYDYSDSISVFVDGKNVYDVNLNYVKPDTSNTLYPYNRKLFKFPKTKIGKSSKCLIVFENSKKKVIFCLDNRFIFYTLEVLWGAP